MKTIYKLMILNIAIVLSGCGSSNVKMTNAKITSTSPSIYSHTFHILGSKRIILNHMYGKVLSVDGKSAAGLTFKRLIVDPGLHKLEMTWEATQSPIDSNNVTSESTYQPMGAIVITGKIVRPKRTYTTNLLVKKGYSYFVNLEEFIINNGNNYRLPKRLCISEVKNGSTSIKIPPAGHVFPLKSIKTITCSK